MKKKYTYFEKWVRNNITLANIIYKKISKMIVQNCSKYFVIVMLIIISFDVWAFDDTKSTRPG